MPLALTGLIPAPFTPFHADGSLHLEAVDWLATHFAQTGVTGAFIAGTTGEGPSLTLEERKALTHRWTAVARPLGLKVIAQIGHNTQADAVALAAHAASAGVDAVSAFAPGFFKPATVDELLDFFAPIASAAAPVPFYFYDIPSMSGVRLPTAEVLERGLDRLPTLRGLKFTNMDLVELQVCLQARAGEFDVLFGHDEVLLAGLALGIHGAVGSTYNFAASLYQSLMNAFERGDWRTARQEQTRSVRLVRVLQQHSFLPAAKVAMRLLTGIDCGPVRSPLATLSASAETSLRNQLEILGFSCK